MSWKHWSTREVLYTSSTDASPPGARPAVIHSYLVVIKERFQEYIIVTVTVSKTGSPRLTSSVGPTLDYEG